MEKLQVTLTIGNCEVNIQQRGTDVHSFVQMVRELINQFAHAPSIYDEDDMVRTPGSDDIDYDRLCDK